MIFKLHGGGGVVGRTGEGARKGIICCPVILTINHGAYNHWSLQAAGEHKLFTSANENHSRNTGII